jgi:hypothetical protein
MRICGPRYGCAAALVRAGRLIQMHGLLASRTALPLFSPMRLICMQKKGKLFMGPT